MILSRAQLLAEVRTLVAAQRINEAVIGRLRLIVAAHEAGPRVAATALADNVRLAHHLEVAELELSQYKAAYHLDQARLARFMADHPDLFRTGAT